LLSNFNARYISLTDYWRDDITQNYIHLILFQMAYIYSAQLLEDETCSAISEQNYVMYFSQGLIMKTFLLITLTQIFALFNF